MRMDCLIECPKLAILFQSDKCAAWNFRLFRPHAYAELTKDVVAVVERCISTRFFVEKLRKDYLCG